MKGKILNFRQSRRKTYGNQMIIHVDKISTRKDAQSFVDKEVIFKTETGKEIKGKVRSAHGNSGALRVLFERGMPGQSLNKEVEVK